MLGIEVNKPGIISAPDKPFSFVLDRLGRSYVGMVNECYDCTIRRQPHGDTLSVYLTLTLHGLRSRNYDNKQHRYPWGGIAWHG